MSTYLNLGNFSKKVTTSSADCQLWIDRGIVHSFGFNRDEAIRCFQRALKFDANCAIAHYFIAYNNAADYNNPDGIDYTVGFKEAQQALDMAKNTPISDWEMALIEAQVRRFCWPVGSESLEELHKNYANAMRPVYQKFGNDDVDIAAIYAEALMMLAPWKLWTSPPDIKPAIPETEELVLVLERALEKQPTHPGLCHFYVHTMELSSTPEKALPAADSLRVSVPEHGHLLHMSSHIDMWVGQYKEAVDINRKAIEADEKYVSMSGQDNEIYKVARMHNYHFAVWAAMFDGQYATAMQYAEAAERQLGPDAVTYKLGDLPIGTLYLEAFASVPWHVLIRFGKWEEILKRPIKEDSNLYPGTIATAHYARGVAFAVTRRIEDAEAEQKKFYSALQNKALENCYLMNNIMYDGKDHTGILDVAEAVLNGEMEYFKGNYQQAFQHLRLAVKRDISLPYDEPWGWMMPTRHVLGALLLEQGEAAEAEAVYREDLKQYKDNMWSLLGLHQALKLQNKKEEADSVKASFQAASARADVKIQASCLCATKTVGDEQCCH